ncbi:hypothetical protein [Bacillus nakamurai]|uniref:hypothetical protein n=1 Tax=Bacillus nakamurai TaxID=1793963 RepID=UPI0020C30624|nr:hypothetical protein [Bacillus nakamurai]MCP6682955.1 hypothetical protein [Bacillus nakamurai]
MAKIIEELRGYGDVDGILEYGSGDRTFWSINELLYDYKPEGYSSQEVYNTFEECGRWSNYETSVYEVNEGGEIAYFELGVERPATECQDGMDLSYHFREVVPQEVTVIKYVAKGRD